eukprot:scaffold490983_cov27-Prasinocladus_malaysianus.AAC.1
MDPGIAAGFFLRVRLDRPKRLSFILLLRGSTILVSRVRLNVNPAVRFGLRLRRRLLLGLGIISLSLVWPNFNPS